MSENQIEENPNINKENKKNMDNKYIIKIHIIFN